METPSGAARWRARIAALALGTLLAALGLGGCLAWEVTYVDGSERCGHCLRVRDVDRRALIWFRSEPFLDSMTPADAATCADHDWHPIGCWRLGSAWATHGAL